MLLLMVANVSKDSRYKPKPIETLLKAQIENSLDLGWEKEKIIILSNHKFSYMGIDTTLTDMNDFCLTGSKMFALLWLYKNNLVTETVWSKDLDVWQNCKFDEPEFKDVGIAQYSNSKYNGGSIFWKPEAEDIALKVVDEIQSNKESREEPTLNKILKSGTYKDRVTVLNNTFNVGCSGFTVRYDRSEKPVRAVHMHPYNRLAWETHALDRNNIGEVAITIRLERIIRKYYTSLATKCVNKKPKVNK